MTSWFRCPKFHIPKSSHLSTPWQRTPRCLIREPSKRARFERSLQIRRDNWHSNDDIACAESQSVAIGRAEKEWERVEKTEARQVDAE
ncbi:hypothetical protein OH76DRAFT_1401151 [Lentinus brumalis]|uniref:Uncharacterized protein n=1 Tax=Lentinus brumalis TaxID=2498619 RepID=A0A371DGS9_9APHY|nr:hypothetical protein OH76DRAFT_1401151 [Polyporus brumalis]